MMARSCITIVNALGPSKYPSYTESLDSSQIWRMLRARDGRFGSAASARAAVSVVHALRVTVITFCSFSSFSIFIFKYAVSERA